MTMPMAQQDIPPRRSPATGGGAAGGTLGRALSNMTVQALDSVQATTSATQVRALLAVEASGGCSNGELAAMHSIFPSSASRLTDRLTAGGSDHQGCELAR